MVDCVHCGWLVCTTQAQAQLLFNLNPAGLSGVPGSTLTFNATLTNTGTDPVFLNEAAPSLSGNGVVLDDSLFLNTPLSMNAGDTWSGDIFAVIIDPTALPGDYTGSFTIVGGIDDAAQDNLVTQNFLVTVLPAATVPEPGAFGLLLGAGCFCGVFVMHRR